MDNLENEVDREIQAFHESMKNEMDTKSSRETELHQLSKAELISRLVEYESKVEYLEQFCYNILHTSETTSDTFEKVNIPSSSSIPVDYNQNIPQPSSTTSSRSFTDKEKDQTDSSTDSFPLIPSPLVTTPPYEYIVLTKENEKKFRIFVNPKIDEIFKRKLATLRAGEGYSLISDASIVSLGPLPDPLPVKKGVPDTDVSIIHCFDPSDVDFELKKIFKHHPPKTHTIVRKKSRMERGSSVAGIDSYYGTEDLDRVGHASYFIPELSLEEKKTIGWESSYSISSRTSSKKNRNRSKSKSSSRGELKSFFKRMSRSRSRKFRSGEDSDGYITTNSALSCGSGGGGGSGSMNNYYPKVNTNGLTNKHKKTRKQVHVQPSENGEESIIPTNNDQSHQTAHTPLVNQRKKGRGRSLRKFVKKLVPCYKSRKPVKASSSSIKTLAIIPQEEENENQNNNEAKDTGELMNQQNTNEEIHVGQNETLTNWLQSLSSDNPMQSHSKHPSTLLLLSTEVSVASIPPVIISESEPDEVNSSQQDQEVEYSKTKKKYKITREKIEMIRKIPIMETPIDQGPPIEIVHIHQHQDDDPKVTEMIHNLLDATMSDFASELATIGSTTLSNAPTTVSGKPSSSNTFGSGQYSGVTDYYAPTTGGATYATSSYQNDEGYNSIYNMEDEEDEDDYYYDQQNNNNWENYFGPYYPPHFNHQGGGTGGGGNVPEIQMQETRFLDPRDLETCRYAMHNHNSPMPMPMPLFPLPMPPPFQFPDFFGPPTTGHHHHELEDQDYEEEDYEDEEEEDVFDNNPNGNDTNNNSNNHEDNHNLYKPYVPLSSKMPKKNVGVNECNVQ